MTLVFVGARGAGPERCGRRARHRTCGRGGSSRVQTRGGRKISAEERLRGQGPHAEGRGEARAGRTTQRERVTRQKGRKSAEVNGGREQKARGKDAADAEGGRSACRGGPVSPRRKRAQRLAGAARECEPAKRRRRLQKATAGAKGGGTGEKARQSVFLPGPRRSACMRGRSLSGMLGSGRLRAAKEGAPRQKEAKKADAGFRSNPGLSAAEAPAESGGRKQAPQLWGGVKSAPEAGPAFATVPCAFSRPRRECRRGWSRDWAGSPAHRRPPSPRAARNPRLRTLRGSCRTRRRKWRTRPRQ